ncbi:hypothetical protein GGI22_005273, partial [Coemansia erecta]
MNAYKVASTFEDRGIRPPPEDSVTVGESDLNFIHLHSGDDSGLLQYVRGGGIAFPHIMIPEALQLRGVSTSAGSVTSHADGKDSVSTKHILRKQSDPSISVSENKEHRTSTEESSALETV